MRGKIFISVIIGVVLLFAQPASAKEAPINNFQAWSTVRQLYQGTFSGWAYPNLVGRPSVQLLPGGQAGAWESPVVTVPSLDAINPSWQADTPPGSHINLLLKVRNNGHWSNWYEMGKWASGNTPSFQRTSVNDQPTQDGTIFTDTYVNTTDGKVDAYQLRVELKPGSNGHSPRVYQVAAQASTQAPFVTVSKTTMHRTVDLAVPAFSQYVHNGEYPTYGAGGEAWCSPTSVAMVLKYWGTGPTAKDIATLPADSVFDAHGRRDGEVAHAAVHTYDAAYEGTGNWPFNTAYAAGYGLDTSVQVFSSLRDIEKQIKHGAPVVVSIAWNNEDDDPENDLPGAISKTVGHLMVVRGFTAQGNVIANDPATLGDAGNEGVRREYPRLAFERQWLNSSNGTVYMIAPR